MGRIPRQETDTQDQDERQTSNLRHRWEWVEATIWTDNMLIALENGVKGRKWFSLIDKVYKENTLRLAWEKVQKNRGASGVDKVTIERFQVKSIDYLKELQKELKEGTYRPQAIRRVYIPKEKGKVRPLGIPTIKDRIAQQAVKMVLEPILEREFLDVSYGFRPKRGAQEAIQRVNELLREGYTWVVDADLQAYFDTIPHKRLMMKLETSISDGRIIELIEKWLEQDILEENKRWTPIKGSPQGAVISPLLANLYLHDLDCLITDNEFKMVRYADDFVILTKSQEAAECALQLVKEWTNQNELTLHPEKTHVGNCLNEGEGFEFLGYRFEAGTTWVRNKSSQRFRDKIKEITKRTCGKALNQIITTLNPVLRGWSEYFKNVTKYTLGTFDSFVRRRLRSILQRQNKKRRWGAGYANMRWPNQYFADHGLFTMEAYQIQWLASQPR